MIHGFQKFSAPMYINIYIYIKEVDAFYFIFIVATSFSFIMEPYFLFMRMIAVLYFKIVKN